MKFQFGIRHIMILTVVVAFWFGLCNNRNKIDLLEGRILLQQDMIDALQRKRPDVDDRVHRLVIDHERRLNLISPQSRFEDAFAEALLNKVQEDNDELLKKALSELK